MFQIRFQVSAVEKHLLRGDFKDCVVMLLCGFVMDCSSPDWTDNVGKTQGETVVMHEVVRVEPSVGVVAVIVCVAVAVFLADLSTAWGRGVFSAGRVRRYPSLLVVPYAACKQARVR